MPGSERRVHARLQVTAEVRVSGPDGVTTGELRDLSKGGAGVRVPEPVGKMGDVLELFLPFPGGVEIAVEAEIVRLTETPEGLDLGVRFMLVEPAMREKLVHLIEALLDVQGTGTRRHPRIIRRIPIHYGKLADLKATLENISRGGLQMTVNTPLVLDQEVEVTVPDPGNKELLIVMGKVVHQQPVKDSAGTKYRVGLEFKELSPAAKRCLDELLRVVLELSRPKVV